MSNKEERTESPSEGKVQMHWVTDQGWIHTHGMDAIGRPELEIRDCPSYLGEAAARILREVCDYMLNTGRVVKAGENMGVSPKTVFHFVQPEPIPGSEDHYEVERLLIVDTGGHCCDVCGLNPAELN